MTHTVVAERKKERKKERMKERKRKKDCHHDKQNILISK
jgi:hypothetical protein